MPGFDRTGPMGHGPATGRGFGSCGRGMGFRRGLGTGFGRGFRRFAAPLTKEDETANLRTEKELVERDIKIMQEELKTIEQRVKELGKE